MTVDQVRKQINSWFEEPREESDDLNVSERNMTVLNFNQEFSETGLLSNYFKLVEGGLKIDIKALLKQIILIDEISKIVSHFESEFGFATLDDFVGNNLTIKIPRPGNRSIGFFYGFMETMLTSHPILEYAAQQTSLEQIFNSFAKESQFRRFNNSIRKQNKK